MNRVAWLVMSVICLSGLEASAGEIRGKVELVSPVPPRAVGKKRVTMASKYGARAAEDASVPTGEDEVRYVVVEVLGENLKATPRKAELIQQNKQFVPHVMAIPRGSSVRFINKDDFEHNVYSVSAPGEFDTGKYQGNYKTQKFEQPNAVEIFCGLHPRMNAYIVVTPNDFFAMPDAKHEYRISGLPPGKYTLRVWHPRLKAKEIPVEVLPSGATTCDLKL
ncbi:MAG: carboxypeptidase regulatory-like domain-containing protein [Candidatus Eremiobacterota bacterium]